jgi:hypothetical protein
VYFTEFQSFSDCFSRRAIKIAYCPLAIRENPASSAANQIALFTKTNACHIIILDILTPTYPLKIYSVILIMSTENLLRYSV